MNIRTILLGGASVVLALGLSAAQAQAAEGGMAPGAPLGCREGCAWGWSRWGYFRRYDGASRQT